MSLKLSGGTDYTSTPINATFTARVTTTTINIPLINDSIAEGPETFDLSFTIPSSLSGQVIPGTITKAVGNITDDTGKTICLIDTLYLMMCIYILIQKHLQCKKARPSKVESYLEVNT